MSDKISFKGTIPVGDQERIKLSTLNGLTGYKITDFRVISITPGAANSELIGQIFAKSQLNQVSATVSFTDQDLLGVAYVDDPGFSVIIFDNEYFNQDIYVTMTDGSGATVAGNYYIEIERIKLNETQAAQLTLKNIRDIVSRESKI
jgi:hypothetical protein